MKNEMKDENFPELKSSSLDENSTSGSDENKALSDKAATSLKRQRSFSDEKIPSSKRAKEEYNNSTSSCSSQASSCSLTEKTVLSIKIESCVSLCNHKPVMSTPAESHVKAESPTKVID